MWSTGGSCGKMLGFQVIMSFNWFQLLLFARTTHVQTLTALFLSFLSFMTFASETALSGKNRYCCSTDSCLLEAESLFFCTKVVNCGSFLSLLFRGGYMPPLKVLYELGFSIYIESISSAQVSFM